MASFSKLPSGKWRAMVRKQGHTLSCTFRLKVEAETWAAEQESRIGRGEKPSTKPITPRETLGDLIDLHLEDLSEHPGPPQHLVGGGQVMLVVVDKDLEIIESYFPQIIGSRIHKRTFQDVVSVGYAKGTVEDEGASRAVTVRFCSGNSLVLPQSLSKVEIAVLRLCISTTESGISLRSRANSVQS